MDKIYRRSTQTSKGVIKKEKNRKRNVIMNFRVSPEEKALIDARITLTGLSRSEFFIQSCIYQQILVKGNIKSFDAIKDSISKIYQQMQEISSLEELQGEDLESLKTIMEIMDYLYGKQNNFSELASNDANVN